MNMLTTQNLLLFFSILLTGLIAGLLYGYSCSVNPGLGKLPAPEYLRAMKSINKSILNPFFFMSFMGTALILPIATWNSYANAGGVNFYLLLAATIIYLGGVVAVTMLGNVPLNESLESFDISAAGKIDLAHQRELFEKSWNRYHAIRTFFSILSLILVIISLIKKATINVHTA